MIEGKPARGYISQHVGEILVNSEGREVRIGLSITAFARRHQLNRQKLTQVLRGKIPSHRGWRLRGVKPIENDFRPVGRPITLANSQGDMRTFPSISAACQELGINYNTLRSAVSVKPIRQEVCGYEIIAIADTP